MNNANIARILNEVADLLELKGESVFKIRAYRRAARSIEGLDDSIIRYYEQRRLEEIPGIGSSIAKKIAEIIEEGELGYLNRLKSEFPEGLVEIMEVPEIGPKTALRLYKELGLTNLEEVRRAAEGGRIRGLKGFGVRSERNILRGIEAVRRRTGRMLLGNAYPLARNYRDYLVEEGGLERVSIAGSLRRMKETIGDVDLLVGSDEPERVMDLFVSYREVREVLAKGATKSSVRLEGGEQVDLRVVGVESYGAALQYFTGSKEHNVELRELAIGKGYKLNEYGVFKKDTMEKLGGREEKDVYEILGLTLIPPELREARGEIKAAADGTLPALVEQRDIRGDLHIHSAHGYCSYTLREIVDRCVERGYGFAGVVDHSPSLGVDGGLGPEQVLEKVKEADRLNEELDGFHIFRGAEVDIKEDGSLDYPDKVLQDLDLVIAAVHSRFNMDERQMTDRILKAMSNDCVDILAHPTGRLIEQREPYPLKIGEVIEAAVDNRVALELNAMPERLDLNDINCRWTKEEGGLVALGSDAHNLGHLRYMEFGVATARRGWLEPKDVLNCRSIEEVRGWIEG